MTGSRIWHCTYFRLSQCRIHEIHLVCLSGFENAKEQASLFIRLWTLKEAYVKAKGLGIAASPGLRSFTFELLLSNRVKRYEAEQLLSSPSVSSMSQKSQQEFSTVMKDSGHEDKDRVEIREGSTFSATTSNSGSHPHATADKILENQPSGLSLQNQKAAENDEITHHEDSSSRQSGFSPEIFQSGSVESETNCNQVPGDSYTFSRSETNGNSGAQTPCNSLPFNLGLNTVSFTEPEERSDTNFQDGLNPWRSQNYSVPHASQASNVSMFSWGSEKKSTSKDLKPRNTQNFEHNIRVHAHPEIHEEQRVSQTEGENASQDSSNSQIQLPVFWSFRDRTPFRITFKKSEDDSKRWAVWLLELQGGHTSALLVEADERFSGESNEKIEKQLKLRSFNTVPLESEEVISQSRYCRVIGFGMSDSE